MKKIILSILACSYLFASCDFLDVGPQDIIEGTTFYQTEKELNIALNGVYATLAEGGLYGNNILGRLALEGDEGYESYSVDAQGVGYYFVSAADIKVLAYWKACYFGIQRANRLLESIDKPKMDSIARSQIEGEAIFLRAYYYFMLVNKFGDVPLVLNFPKSPRPEDTQVERTPQAQVYAKIIDDMELAATKIQNISKGGGRVNKSAVWGTLSRVCLHMAGEPVKDDAKYAEAAKWAKKVMDTKDHSLNPSYQQVFINYAQDVYDTKESIFEVEFWGNNTGSYTNVAGMVGRNNGIVNNNQSDNIGYSIGAIRATGILVDLYKTGDLRKDWNIAPFYYSKNTTDTLAINKTDTIYWSISGSKFQRYCGKYRRLYETITPRVPNATQTNYPLLRYSDVLLMYAEAINKKSDRTGEEVSAAYDAINQVRRRAFGFSPTTANATIDLTESSKPIGETLLSEIQDERARELCFEALRKNDLVRWGNFYKKMKAVIPEITPGTSSYIVAAQTIYNNATQRDVIWPIPTYEMGVNRKLVQNPGW